MSEGYTFDPLGELARDLRARHAALLSAATQPALDSIQQALRPIAQQVSASLNESLAAALAPTVVQLNEAVQQIAEPAFKNLTDSIGRAFATDFRRTFQQAVAVPLPGAWLDVISARVAPNVLKYGVPFPDIAESADDSSAMEVEGGPLPEAVVLGAVEFARAIWNLLVWLDEKLGPIGTAAMVGTWWYLIVRWTGEASVR